MPLDPRGLVFAPLLPLADRFRLLFTVDFLHFETIRFLFVFSEKMYSVSFSSLNS